MTYEETIELENNVMLKNRADEIYKKFKKNISFRAKDYKGKGRFLHWSDSYNATYFELDSEDRWVFVCDFIHEDYRFIVTPSYIFGYLKKDAKGIGHLVSAVRDK